MWRDAVKMLVQESIYALRAPHSSAPVQNNEAFLNKAAEEISAYVEDTIVEMPWFFRIPILGIATLTAVIGVFVTGKGVGRATPGGRRRVISVARIFPLYGNFSKLVRSLSLLAYFDIDKREAS